MSSVPLQGEPLPRRPIADYSTPTPVGVDVGSTNRLFAATTIAGGPDGALVTDAGYVQALFSEFQSATHRLGAAPEYDPDCLGDVVARYWPRIRRAMDAASAEIVSYARSYPEPVLVVEDLGAVPRPLADAKCGQLPHTCWIPPVALAVLVERAGGTGIPVRAVDPAGTSQRCHRCDHTGELGGRTLKCTNEACDVEEVCRDRSAAVSIAKRRREKPN